MTDDERILDAAEQSRLDSILVSARNLHYANLAVAATAIVASLVQDGAITVPLLAVQLPAVPAVIALYLLSIFLTIANDRLFHQAYRWIRLDPRRPVFPWYALGFERVSYFGVTCWLFLPVVVTALAASQTLGKELAGTALLMPGFLLASTPRLVDRYGQFIRERRDHRGGPATLSMWLLYIYRITRSALLCLIFGTLVIGAVPTMRDSTLRISTILTVCLITLFVLRSVGGMIYRRIDQLGSRLGFAATNRHDYGR